METNHFETDRIQQFNEFNIIPAIRRRLNQQYLQRRVERCKYSYSISGDLSWKEVSPTLLSGDDTTVCIPRRTFLTSMTVSGFLFPLLKACKNDGTKYPSLKAFIPGEPDAPNPPWIGPINATKILYAELKDVPVTAETKVTVMISRHRPWDGLQEVRTFEVQRQSGDPQDSTTRTYSFIPPFPGDFRDTQLVFFQWFVDIQQSADNWLLLTNSPRQSFRIGGFTSEQTNEALLAIQESILQRFDGPSDPLMIPAVPTHLDRCLRGMGVAYVRPQVSGPIALMEPQLLFYLKRNDGTFRLVGWGYGQDHHGLDSHPAVSPIPWEAWFIHEAGWHPANGGFLVTPPPADEDVPRGRAEMEEPPLPVGFNGVWHPRIWDLHIFRRDVGIPFMEIFDPTLTNITGCENWDQDWFFHTPDLDVQPRG
ncbi:hypothetical protein [Larkinella soli]|uniref:hypothetical protein n=1 Tax=Larkinella soli TaxID=1770527 RepID=UPI000FFC5B85|nr:hypothetical protein [Larkinella soli]